MQNSLSELFVDLRDNKRAYLDSTESVEFDDSMHGVNRRAGTGGVALENRISAQLDKSGFVCIAKDDVDAFARVKKMIHNRTNVADVENICPRFGRHYMPQPFGSQNYPDFLVFCGKRIFGMETKYSKSTNGKPVWNSGLPRLNGIYIFGALARRDLTFFRGSDILSAADAARLHEFFKELKTSETEFNENMREQPYGFAAYIRKAFDQKKSINPHAVTDMFTNPRRTELENAVIERLR